MRFLFLQTVGAKPVDGRHQLFTRDYAYKLTMANDKAPFVRWEYVKPRGPGDKRCRHHLQGPIELVMGLKRAYLNDLHLPTGWITFEEVIRFCIVDLGVPHLDSGWNGVLLESYRLFKEEFAPLGTI